MITLYGSIVTDAIMLPNETIVRTGGIANLQRAFELLGDECVCLDHYKKYDLAIIVIDPETSSKNTCYIPIGSEKYVPTVGSGYGWHHIAYLDVLPHVLLSHLKQMRGTVSADLCLESYTEADRGRILTLAKHIDYMFMSKESAKALGVDRNIATKATIVHSSVGSCTYLNDIIYVNTVKSLCGLNVLGAGDAFAASFINNMMIGTELNTSIKLAHRTATELIQNGY